MQNSQLDDLPELGELYFAFAFESPITPDGQSGMLLVPFDRTSPAKIGDPEYFIAAYAPGRLAAWEALHGSDEFSQLSTWTHVLDKRGATVWKALVTAADRGAWDEYDIPHGVDAPMLFDQTDLNALSCPVFSRRPVRELDITTWKPACSQQDCAARPEHGVRWHTRFARIGILCREHAAQAATDERCEIEPLENYTLDLRCDTWWRSHSCDLPFEHHGPHVCRSECGFDQPDETEEAWSSSASGSYVLTRWSTPAPERRSAASVIAWTWVL